MTIFSKLPGIKLQLLLLAIRSCSRKTGKGFLISEEEATTVNENVTKIQQQTKKNLSKDVNAVE